MATYVVTGVLRALDGNRIRRDDLEIVLNRLGHALGKRVIPTTTAVVVGETQTGPTNKMREAERLGRHTERGSSFMHYLITEAYDIRDTEVYHQIIEILSHGTTDTATPVSDGPAHPVLSATEAMAAVLEVEAEDERTEQLERREGIAAAQEALAKVLDAEAEGKRTEQPEQPEPVVQVKHSRRRKIRVRQHTKIDYT